MEMVKNEVIIALSCADVWLGEDGIVRLIYHPNVKVTIREAKEVVEAINTASKGSMHPLYADMRGLVSMTREARGYYGSKELTQWISAVATYDSLISKVIVEFCIRLNKPPFPMKYFTSEESALNWLQEYL